MSLSYIGNKNSFIEKRKGWASSFTSQIDRSDIFCSEKEDNGNECLTKLTPRQLEFSMKFYNRAICWGHQQKYKA